MGCANEGWVTWECGLALAAEGDKMAQYLSITSLSTSPVTAQQGDQVLVGVYIKNLWTAGIYIIPLGSVNGAELDFADQYKAVEAGDTVSWAQFFTMPNKTVTVRVGGWYWSEESSWIKNDEKIVTVELSGADPGKIEVTSLVVPGSANPGEAVSISITVRNDFSTSKNVKVLAVMNNVDIVVSPESSTVAAGNLKTFVSSFTMPTVDAIIGVGSFYEDAGAWLPSGGSTDRVSVAGDEPPVSNIVITKVELEYDETRGTAPVSDVPLGNEGLVHVYRKNNGTTSQKVCVAWTVTDPDSVTVEQYQTCETFNTGPGETDDFIGGRFDLDKLGSYMINVLLYVSPDLVDPVDSYNGVLCIVASTAPPNGDEGISKASVWTGELGLWAELSEQIPPATGVKTNYMFKIEVVGVNPSTEASRMGIHYIITKPDESTIEKTVEEAWPYTGGGESHTFKEPAGINEAYSSDQVGSWSILVELLDDGVVIDEWSGVLFDVEQAPMSAWDIMGMIPYMMVIMMLGMVMQNMPVIQETVRREAPKLAEKGIEKTKGWFQS